MDSRSAIVAILAASCLLAACDRADLREIETRTERKLEQVAPVVEDAVLTAKVKAALIAEPDVTGTAIDVDTGGSVVTLTGSVGSAAVHDRAGQVARGIEGVREVRNELVVKP